MPQSTPVSETRVLQTLKQGMGKLSVSVHLATTTSPQFKALLLATPETKDLGGGFEQSVQDLRLIAINTLRQAEFFSSSLITHGTGKPGFQD